MAEREGRRLSEWRRLFRIAVDLIDQLHANAGGYDFEWSFGGGTAMMIQIGHRESHDIDIFLDDPQLLGFIDPSRSPLSFEMMPADYLGDGLRFQKFTFENVGEIDFIVAGPLTNTPFEIREVEGRAVRLETIPEIIARRSTIRDRKPHRETSSTSQRLHERTCRPSSVLSALSRTRFPGQGSGWKS